MIHCVDLLHFVYSSLSGRLGCFHFLTVINNASVDVCVKVLEGTHVFMYYLFISDWLQIV